MLLVLFIAFGVFVTYEIYQAFTDAQEAELESCISSLQGYLMETLRDEEIRRIINPSKEWKTLNYNEREVLFESLPSNKRFNCGDSSLFVDGKFQNRNDLEVKIRKIDYAAGMELHIKDSEFRK